MNYAEKATAKGKRIKTAWITLGVGVVLLTAGFFAEGMYILMGVGLGGIGVMGAIHGLVSKPVVTLGEDRAQITGWLIPSGNLDIQWDDVASARITTDAAGNKVFWLTDKLGKLKGIESTRFEGYEEIDAFCQKKLAEKGIEVAAVTLPAPTPK